MLLKVASCLSYKAAKKGTGYANGIHNRKDDHNFQSLGFR